MSAMSPAQAKCNENISLVLNYEIWWGGNGMNKMEAFQDRIPTAQEQLKQLWSGSGCGMDTYLSFKIFVANQYLSVDIYKTICFACDYVFHIFSCIDSYHYCLKFIINFIT